MSCISICSWWWCGYHIYLSVRISDRTEKESDQIAPKRETGLQCRARFVVSLAIKQTYTIRIDLLVFFFFFYYFCHTSPRTVKVFRFLPLSAASHRSSSNSNKTSLCCTSSRHWLTHFFFYQVLKNLLFVFNVPDGKNRILSSCTPPRANHVPTFLLLLLRWVEVRCQYSSEHIRSKLFIARFYTLNVSMVAARHAAAFNRYIILNLCCWLLLHLQPEEWTRKSRGASSRTELWL